MNTCSQCSLGFHTAEIRDLLIALQIAMLALASVEPQIAESAKGGPDVRFYVDRILHRHPVDHGDAFLLPRVLFDAGLVNEGPEVHDRFIDEFRHALYSTISDFGERESAEHTFRQLEELLRHYQYQLHRRRESGPSYSEVFLRFFFETMGGRNQGAWAERMRSTLRYLR